jgi:chaperonin GroES
MALRPLGDRVLIQILQAKEKTASGLFIPSTAQEKPNEGTVIAVGPGRWTDSGRFVEPTVKKGDVVLLPKYVGTEVTIDGKPHLVLSEEEIIGVVDNS